MKIRSSRIRILTVTAALLLLLCAACGGPSIAPSNNIPANTSNDAPVNSSNTVSPEPSYVLPPDGASRYAARENGLVISNGYEVNSVNCISISGLKDKAVQKKINDKIRSEADRLLDPSFMPQGRGIKLYEKLAVPTVSIFSNSYANCDNILSVALTCSRLYRIQKEIKQIMYIQPLNFDLATGELLSLADIFPEGMDVKQYLNDRLLQLIQSTDPSKEYTPADDIYYYIPHTVPALISEFKGIRDDQPFYLTDKGELSLVLDFENSEFYMPRGTETVDISISDVYAAGMRFGGNRELYEDNTDRYHIVNPQIPGGEILSAKQLSEYVDADADHFAGNVSLMHYPQLTEKQNDFLSMGFVDLESMLKREADELTEYRKNHSGGDKYIDISTYAYRSGNYLNLSASFVSMFSAPGGVNDITEQRWLRCMEYGSDEPLKISSIFKEGADWKSVLKDAMIRTAEDRRDRSEDPHSERFGAYLDDMINRINGFNIGYSNLILSFDGSSAAELFEDHEKNNWYYASIGNLTFENIGFEHLNIFE